MASDPKKLYKSAMSLSDQERAELIGLLLESLDTEEEPGVEAAWLKEIDRRIAELDSAKVESVPWSEVRARVFDISAN